MAKQNKYSKPCNNCGEIVAPFNGTLARHRELCAEIHRKFGRKLGLPYWESCSLADEIYFGETTKKKLFANLTEATEENE